MISRRSVRLKVAQALYSAKIQEISDLKYILNQFDKSISKTIELNLVALEYIKQILLCSKDHDIREHAKINIQNKQEVSLEILNTKLFKFLETNEEYLKLIKKYKIENKVLNVKCKPLYFEAIKLSEYEAFINNPIEENAYIFFKRFFNKLLFSNLEILESLEDEYENIEEDFDLIHFALKRTLKRNIEQDNFQFSLGQNEWKKEGEFAEDMIKVYLANFDNFEKLISPKLKGWDIARIPTIQIVLIKMALSEFLYFENIPTKVTLNEYIDLAKIFCDTKSKIFVNGILDNLQRELTAEYKIVKKGRGLD